MSAVFRPAGRYTGQRTAGTQDRRDVCCFQTGRQMHRAADCGHTGSQRCLLFSDRPTDAQGSGLRAHRIAEMSAVFRPADRCTGQRTAGTQDRRDVCCFQTGRQMHRVANGGHTGSQRCLLFSDRPTDAQGRERRADRHAVTLNERHAVACATEIPGGDLSRPTQNMNATDVLQWSCIMYIWVQ